MQTHRVLLLSAHPLLSEGLANLLGATDDIALIGPRAISGFALPDLSKYAPDIVLFAAQEIDDAITNALVFQILQHVPDLPVIQVDLSGKNIVRVYTSHTLPARSADLIETIRKLSLQKPGNTAQENEI